MYKYIKSIGPGSKQVKYTQPAFSTVYIILVGSVEITTTYKT